MPDLTTTEATTKDEIEAAPPEAAAKSGDGADATTKGPRVSRARAKTVPARPEPEALPSAASAFASKRGAVQSADGGTGSAVMATTAESDRMTSAAEAASSDAEIVRGAIGRLDARSVAVTQGAVGAGRAESLSLEMSAIGAAAAADATISRSIARAVLAGEVHLEQSAAQTVGADRVTMSPGSMAVVVFARRVEGEIKPLFDWRGGLALGAAIGVVLALVRPGRRRR